MVKFKDFADGRSKEENVRMAKQLSEALPAKISEIHNLEVGINITEGPNAFDLVSSSEYRDMDAVRRTVTHPEHDKFAAFLKKVTEASYSVNYEKP
jgi:hypothetical protein